MKFSSLLHLYVMLSLVCLFSMVYACDYTKLRNKAKEARRRRLDDDNDDDDDDDDDSFFDYSDGKDGPANWPKKFSTCGGDQQSPVNIPGKGSFDGDAPGTIPAFNFAYKASSTPEIIKFENNGKTVEAVYTGLDFKLTDAENLALIVGRAKTDNNEYTLEQFHFHWGDEDDEGSEHTFDGKQFPLEMHLVHFNSAKYGSVAEAAGFADGILVVAVYFDINKDSSVKPPGYLEPFVNIMSQPDFVSGIEHEVEDFELDSLVSDLNTKNFYLYNGGLTTPTCNEVVTWVLMQDILLIDEETINTFRNVIGDKGQTIGPNFRPTQKGNSRTVFDAKTQTSAIISAGIATSSSYVLGLLSVLVAVYSSAF